VDRSVYDASFRWTTAAILWTQKKLGTELPKALVLVLGRAYKSVCHRRRGPRRRKLRHRARSRATGTANGVHGTGDRDRSATQRRAIAEVMPAEPNEAPPSHTWRGLVTFCRPVVRFGGAGSGPASGVSRRDRAAGAQSSRGRPSPQAEGRAGAAPQTAPAGSLGVARPRRPDRARHLRRRRRHCSQRSLVQAIDATVASAVCRVDDPGRPDTIGDAIKDTVRDAVAERDGQATGSAAGPGRHHHRSRRLGVGHRPRPADLVRRHAPPRPDSELPPPSPRRGDRGRRRRTPRDARTRALPRRPPRPGVAVHDPLTAEPSVPRQVGARADVATALQPQHDATDQGAAEGRAEQTASDRRR
jgi:hypothetical protein